MENTQDSGGGVSRRDLLGVGGFLAIVVAFLGQGYAMVRSLVPNVLYEPPKQIPVGKPSEFDQGCTFLDKYKLFVVREKNDFYTISSVCTHLGCNVKAHALAKPRTVEVMGRKFTESMDLICPCHGSVFDSDGSVIGGPAPSDLPRFPVVLSPKDGQLIVDTAGLADSGFRLTVQV
jgi:Rieske Fe-S protein